jgi:hypothetical protein
VREKKRLGAEASFQVRGTPILIRKEEKYAKDMVYRRLTF